MARLTRTQKLTHLRNALVPLARAEQNSLARSGGPSTAMKGFAAPLRKTSVDAAGFHAGHAGHKGHERRHSGAPPDLMPSPAQMKRSVAKRHDGNQG